MIDGCNGWSGGGGELLQRLGRAVATKGESCFNGWGGLLQRMAGQVLQQTGGQVLQRTKERCCNGGGEVLQQNGGGVAMDGGGVAMDGGGVAMDGRGWDGRCNGTLQYFPVVGLL